MNLINNLKVKTKLISAFLILAVLIGIVGAIGARSLKNVNSEAEEMYNIGLQHVNEILSIKSNMSEIKSEVATIMYEKDQSQIAKSEKNITDNVEEDNQYIESYTNSPMTDNETKLWEEFNDNTKKYREARDKVIASAKSNNFEEAQKQYLQMMPLQTSMMDRS